MITMLIVDDDSREHDVIRYLLKKYSFDIETSYSTDGLQAKKLLEENVYDILLTDVQMPYMNGLDLAKFCKKRNPNCEILFFSGYDDFDYIKEALSLKAINYILKPISPDEFRQSMQEILENISKKGNPYREFEKSLSQNFYEEKAPVQKEKLTVNMQDDELLKNIDDAVRIGSYTSLDKNAHMLIGKYKYAKKVSHIYIRYLFSSLLKILIPAIPGLPEEDFQKAIEKIYTLNHFSDLCDYVEQYIDQVLSVLKRNDSTPNYAINHVIQYIEKHYSDDLGLDQLAEQVYLSPKYLSTVFAQTTGTTLNKYIRSVRLKKAAELTRKTNRKIADISMSVGYPNVSYFCKLFTEEYGMTPEKYRTGTQTKAITHD